MVASDAHIVTIQHVRSAAIDLQYNYHDHPLNLPLSHDPVSLFLFFLLFLQLTRFSPFRFNLLEKPMSIYLRQSRLMVVTW